MIRQLLGLAAAVCLAAGKPISEATCGYASCKDIDVSVGLHVHLVPHSHDDVGWLKTVDAYFTGSDEDI